MFKGDLTVLHQVQLEDEVIGSILCLSEHPETCLV